MRRIALIAALLARRARSRPPPAAGGEQRRARLLGCESALDPAARAATFEGRMRTVRKARAQAADALHAADAPPEEPRLARAAGPRLRQVADAATPASAATSTRSASSRSPRPASYRTLVRFRWLDADGDRVASSTATSPVCRQPDLRPNLRPLGVEARAGADAAHARYLVPVVNRGRSLAGPVRRRRLGRRHRRSPRRRRPSSQPGERALVEVQGPPCTRGSDADRRRRPDRRGRRARRGRQPAQRAVPGRARLRKRTSASA